MSIPDAVSESRSAGARRGRSGKWSALVERVGKSLRWGLGAICLSGLVMIISTAVRIGSAPVMDWALALACLVGMSITSLPGRFASALRLRLTLAAAGLAVGLGVAELGVRLLAGHSIGVRGGRINLPVNSRTEHDTRGVPGLEPRVVVSFNSLGFRGPEPPSDWDEALTVLCVGGSTTQCTYLSDGKTWPDQLAHLLEDQFAGLWLNNAGIDGHSTFGHLHLVEQYIAKLRPDVILLFVGINDIGRRDLNRFDRQALRTDYQEDDSVSRRLLRSLLRRSDLLALLDNLRRQQNAKSLGLTHQANFQHRPLADLQSLQLDEQQRQRLLADHDAACLRGYRERLTQLVERCAEIGSRVVLVTQPALFGEGHDPVTGIDLERVQVRKGVDGWTQWQLLKQYNRVTREVGQAKNVTVIDLESRIPKSSQYYYDLLHYTNAGAERVAKEISSQLAPLLSSLKRDE